MADGTGPLAELRQLVASLDSDWSALTDEATNSVHVRATVAGRVRECNQLAAECRFLADQRSGLHRVGPKAGEQWGHWAPKPHGEGPTCVEGEECHMDFLPRSTCGDPLTLFWETTRKSKRGTPKAPYLAFGASPGMWGLRVHRQVWEDVYGLKLPRWIHVDHVSSELTDCRLSSLQLLPFWLNSAKKLKSQQGLELRGRVLARREEAASTAAAAAAAAGAAGAAAGAAGAGGAAGAAAAGGGDRASSGAAAAPARHGSLLKRRRLS